MNEVEMIPRRILFGNPDRAMVKVSPDGSRLSYVAPEEGVLNLWVAPREKIGEARAITHDRGRGIQHYIWAYTNRHLLYVQDSGGDENYRLYAIDLESGETKDLTPFPKVRVIVQQATPKAPEEVVAGINDRDPQWHDLYRINITTGERTLLVHNDRFTGILVDDRLRVRLALSTAQDGSQEIWRPLGDGQWERWETIPYDDTMNTGPFDFDQGGNTLFILDSRGRNTSALLSWDLENDTKRVLAEDPQCDVEDLLFHPAERRVQGVAFIYERKRWQLLDPAVETDFAFLRGVADGEFEVASRSLDDRYWIVAFSGDDNPVRYHLYDRTRPSASFLFTNRSELEGRPLVAMHSKVIQARDGLDLILYYTLPAGSDSKLPGIPDQPLPMVFAPHGGPWYRNRWGFDPVHQWLANRGYAVLCVNFRSSTGLGKAFLNAGNREWGGAIMDDQEDAVRWAVEAGVADPKRIAVFGGSFGGYSVLAGLTRSPELFACGVDLVGPSNLITFLESVPPYWKPVIENLARRIGDHRTEEGRQLLRSHSPLTAAERIVRPLLIAQGANDPRVKRAESDQIVEALRAKGIPVTYLLYPDEGHGFVRPENRVSFHAVAEAFLARHLGGRFEPIGDELAGASMQVLEGKEGVPGLAEAL